MISASGFRFSVLLLLTLLPAVSIAQHKPTTEALQLRASYRKGAIVPLYSVFTWLTEEYVHAAEIAFAKKSTGQSYWNQIYNYPSWGMALQIESLGNNRVFGHGLSFYPYYMIPLLEAGNLAVIQKGGLGIGAVSRRFHATENPENVAMGSTLNIHFNFELLAQYRLTKNLEAFTGLSFDHLSNGNLAEPNLGINYVSVQIGGQYMLGRQPEKQVQKIPEHRVVNEASLILSAGLKHGRSLQSRKYLASSLSLEWKRRWWRIFTPGIGADLFYDGATRAEKSRFSDSAFRPVDQYRTGIHLSQEIQYGKFSVSLQEGLYVGLTEKVFNQKMYNRLIIRQRFSGHYFAQVAIRSHLSVLDVVELGIGYNRQR